MWRKSRNPLEISQKRVFSSHLRQLVGAITMLLLLQEICLFAGAVPAGASAEAEEKVLPKFFCFATATSVETEEIFLPLIF